MSEKKKVLEFVGQLGDGGAETLVVSYAKMLDRTTFDVAVLTIYNDNNTANSKRLIENNILVLSVFNKHNYITKIIWHVMGRKYMTFRLKKIIQKFKPDVIHVHLENLKYLVPISDMLKDIKVLYTCHSLPEQKLMGKNEEEGKAARQLIKDCDLKLIALHEDMKDELNSMFHISDTIIIRNGVDRKQYTSLKETKTDIRKSLEIPINSFVVGHIGRFSEVKNHMFLLEVFRFIKEKKKEAYLLLVGNGENYNKVQVKIKEMKIENDVTILSHRTDIPRILNAMDLFVFPSLYEGLSVTLVEAQTVGLRCVISDNINRQNILSENTIQVSLDKTAEEWADLALDYTKKSDRYGDITEYDLNREIKVLEKIYLE